MDGPFSAGRVIEAVKLVEIWRHYTDHRCRFISIFDRFARRVDQIAEDNRTGVLQGVEQHLERVMTSHDFRSEDFGHLKLAQFVEIFDDLTTFGTTNFWPTAWRPLLACLMPIDFLSPPFFTNHVTPFYRDARVSLKRLTFVPSPSTRRAALWVVYQLLYTDGNRRTVDSIKQAEYEALRFSDCFGLRWLTQRMQDQPKHYRKT